jgi:amino acid adenylation domain-containing protein
MTAPIERIRALSPDKRRLLERALIGDAERTPIAIVGVGCRFPGANDYAEFGVLLERGGDAITEVPRERFDIDAWYDADPDADERVYTRFGGFISDVDRFDAGAFRISPREAAAMDPQQRLLIETTWQALEHAATPAHTLMGSATGVFVGVSGHDYLHLLGDDARPFDGYAATGNSNSLTAGRLAYLLGARGPALAVDTACSSSLVATHLARASLMRRECDLAIAAGVNLLLWPRTTVACCRAGLLAPDGRCKTFDASADGYGRGEGCGVVILQRLDDALAAGRRVLAVIEGSAIGHDGRTSGLTVPSGSAQQEVVRAALVAAGVTPAAVGYVECHGTGTALGDPIEATALGAVYGAASDERGGPILLGSVKTNVGHLEAAAGIAGLIKATISLSRGRVFANLHQSTINPRIDTEALGIQIPAAGVPWPAHAPRRAGVSSFGFSGTNAHLLLRAHEPSPASPRSWSGPVVLPLSAGSEAAVRTLAGQLANAVPSMRAIDVAATLACGRSPARTRAAVLANGDLAGALEPLATGTHSVWRAPADAPRIAFAFTGHGPQYGGMGSASWASSPSFREVIERAARHLGDVQGRRLISVFEGDDTPLEDWVLAQLAIHTLQVALAAQWASLGVRPTAVIGHSLGEYAAAVVSGALTVESGIELVEARARIVRERGLRGGMAAVLAPAARVAELIASFSPDELSIAAINAPENTVISGTEEALTAALSALESAGLDVERLRIAHPSHAPTTEPALDAFEAAARAIPTATPQIALVSNVTGQVLGPGERTDAAYWRRHLRAPVRFAEGIVSLAPLGATIALEIGPSSTLLALGRASAPSIAWLSSLKRGRDEQLLETVGALWCRGVPIDWEALYGGVPSPPADLPSTPPSGERYGVSAAELRPRSAATNTLPRPAPQHFVRRLDPHAEPALADHRIDDKILVAGAHQLSLVAEAAFERGVRPVELTEVVWSAPLWVDDGGTEVEVKLIDGRFQVWANGVETCTGTYARSQTQTSAWSEPVTRSHESGARFYARLEDLGFSLRGEFRSIQSLALDEHGADAELAGGYPPALMDGAVQTLGAALLEAAPVPRLMVPFSVERVRMTALPRTQAQARGVVRGAASATPTGDVRIRDGHGDIIVELDGLVLRPFGASESKLTSAFYTPTHPPLPPITAPVSAMPVRTVGELEASTLGLTADPGAHVVLASWEGVALERVLLEMARVIDGLPSGGRLLWITRGAHALGAAVDPAAAAQLGFLRAATRERPDLELIALDLPPGAALDGAVIRAELTEPGSREVVWRGARHAFAMVPARLVSGRRPWVPRGVYLITGGQGGVGYQLALTIATEVRGARLILVNRQPIDAQGDVTHGRRRDVDALRALGAEVWPVAADVSDPTQVAKLIDEVRARHGRLDGVVHAAGTIADGALGTLDASRLEAVLAPKVEGARHLDRVTRASCPELSAFVLVSSAAGVFGSPGQANYAAANAWLDGLAYGRRQAGLPALSIAWGAWGETGMVCDDEHRARLERAGIAPIDNRLGRAAFLRALEQPEPLLAFVPTIEVAGVAPARRSPSSVMGEAIPAVETPGLVDYLTALVAESLGLDPCDVAADVPFMEMGLDSIMAVRLRRRIERETSLALETTLLFERPTIATLAAHLSRHHGEVLAKALRGTSFAPVAPVAPSSSAPVAPAPIAPVAPAPIAPTPVAAGTPLAAAPSTPAAPAPRSPASVPQPVYSSPSRDVAIVGVACRLPGADTPEQFFTNLLERRCFSAHLPEQRRRWMEAGGSSAPAGARAALISDIDAFDAAHFGLDPDEVCAMDPQQRLFLEVAWEALERAGYSPESLPDRRAGVYVGLASHDYDALSTSNDPRKLAGCLGSFVASRVAYALDLHGPAMVVDAACASSLVSVHLAVQSLRVGECRLAIAGGTNVALLGEPTLLFEAHKNLSADGRCRAYDARGAGYFRGEGVVAFVLRPLEDALAAHDPIVAVIKGTAVVHDGRARAGIVAPGPAGQAAVVRAALDDARVDAEQLEYVEGHGTGTALGDPLELRGLSDAIRERTSRRSFIGLGSVKPSVGHGEAVAGATSLLAAAMSLSRRIIPPNGRVEVPTEAFDVPDSPFYLADCARPYRSDRPLTSVHCYGMGGIDAHVVLQAPPPRAEASIGTGDRLIVLSGVTEAALAAQVTQLLSWLSREPDASLGEVAQTLGSGRRHHRHRLAVVASALDVLADRLQLFRWAGRDPTLRASRIYVSDTEDKALLDDLVLAPPELRGWVRALTRGRYAEKVLHPLLATDAPRPATPWVELPAKDRARALSLVGRAYVHGATVDFGALAERDARRLLLPTYPFQRERFWWPEQPRDPRAAAPVPQTPPPSSARPAPTAPSSAAAPTSTAARTSTVAPTAPARVPTAASAPPLDPTEEALLQLVARASLRVGVLDEHSLDANLLELGLDSVAVMRTAYLVERTFGVRLTASTLFQHGTLGALARDVAARTTLDAEAITRRLQALEGTAADRTQPKPRQDAPFDCTPLQQAYLAAARMGGGLAGRSGQIFVELHIDGTLDRERIQASYCTLLERHPMLRAVFHEDGRQSILPDIPPRPVEIHPRGDDSASATEATLDQTRAGFLVGRADPHIGPLHRAAAVELDGAFRLFLAVNLLVIDVQSAFILIDEWRRTYVGEPLAPAPTLGFDEYLAQTAASGDPATVEADRGYWRDRLPDFPMPPRLPLAADPRRLVTAEFASASAALDGPTWERLGRFAEAHALTRAALLGGALADILARHAEGDDDFCLNLPVFDRRPVHPEVDRMVGPFSSTLLVRAQGGPGTPIERGRALQREIEAALDHRSLSGIDVARMLAQHRRTLDPVAPVVFTAALYGGRLPRWGRIETLSSHTPHVWLDVQTLETADGLMVRFDHQPALLPPLLVQGMLEDYTNLLRTLAETALPSDSDVSALRLSAVDELDAVVTLDDTVARRAARSPNLHAVAGDGQPLSYGALDAWANRIAHALVRSGVAMGDRVAIACRRGAAQVAATVGALRAGGVYVPIDLTQPAARQVGIIEDAGARVVLTDGVTSIPTSATILSVEASRVASFPSEALEGRRRGGEDLAYIIFTSGSTGRPKGVMISHASALNTIEDINRRFAVGPHDRILGFSSLGFDLSVYDLFGAFAAGATLVVLPEAELREPARWMTRLREHGVTIWNSVPTGMSMLTEWLRGKSLDATRTLRLVMLSGDWIPVDLPHKIRAQFPAAQVVSLGGATEGSIWSCIYPIREVDARWSSVPYGRALTNQSFYVLDEALRPVSPGAVGQLYIGGRGVALGYWNDPEKTAASFVTGPDGVGRLYKTGDLGRWTAPGEMEFLGREDLQVKIRGFRVELSEIEAALLTHPAIASCAVVAVGERTERELSVHYVVSAEVSVKELKEHLEARVPGYMVPSRFTQLPELPLNVNGKIDRARLA